MVTTLVNGKVVASSKVVLPPTTELKAESGEKESMQHQHSLVVVSEESHTAPQRCQPDRLGTLDFLLDSCYCDRDMTISVAG